MRLALYFQRKASSIHSPYDILADRALLTVTQTGHEPGIACHTGRHSCFFQRLDGGQWQAVEPVLKDPETIYK